MVFETKKLQNETLSEYLKEIRQSLGLTIAEVSLKTGIKGQYVELLETAQFQILPPNVYVVGFLKELARMYKVSDIDLIQQFKKECAMVDPKRSKIITKTPIWKSVFSNMVITPKLVSIGVGVLFVLISVGYIVFQLVAIASPPKLVITEPKPGQVISDSVVSVLGKTEPGTTLKINDQTIFVDSNGDFKASVGVTNGQKELAFKASDKFNHEVKRVVSVIVNQQTVAAVTTQLAQAQAQKQPVTVKFEFSGAATIAIKKDGEAAVEEKVKAGDKKEIVADQQVIFSTTNAGATSITFNDKKIGALGRKGEVIKNIIFSEESAKLMVDSTTPSTTKN